VKARFLELESKGYGPTRQELPLADITFERVCIITCCVSLHHHHEHRAASSRSRTDEDQACSAVKPGRCRTPLHPECESPVPIPTQKLLVEERMSP
jgi:hypothetical protein